MTPVLPFVAAKDLADRDAWLSALRTAMPAYRILPLDALSTDEREAATVAIVANPEPADLAMLPHLVWVQSLWAGVERLLPTLGEARFAVVRLVDPELARTMAEAVLTWTLFIHRDGPRYLAQQRRRQWIQHPLPAPGGREVGVLGLGHLGRAAAARLRDNGFVVHGWNRRPVSMIGVRTRHGGQGLFETLRQADVVVVLLPLTDETRGLLNEAAVAEMRPGAAVINFARGAVVVEPALLAGLDEGRLSHAVLDVFATEPLPVDHPFWAHPKVTVTPHVAAPTNRGTASAIVGGNVDRYFTSGEVPLSVSRKKGY